ncbi:unnamed protein product [Caenorhabditis sp. 36 PRJEB53466]|nr:unnamed protein product [Caenorhabditis sp. 36 PRJEB53466]
MEESRSSPPNVQKQYVVLDQTFVVFDIDQPKNACQKLRLNRLAGVGPIYWRFQTNAPTRYIVSPNHGILRDDEPVEVTVTLWQNRFRPRHELFLQAAPVAEGFDPKTLFETVHEMQVTYLDLGTTVMKIESAVESQKSVTDLTQALDATATTGRDRLDQLQSILNLAVCDTEQIAANISQAKQLKVTLDAQLEQKIALVAEYKSKLTVLESSYMRKSAEVNRLQNELLNQHKMNAMKASTAAKNVQNCTIS